jgi:hypothetical protein
MKHQLLGIPRDVSLDERFKVIQFFHARLVADATVNLATDSWLPDLGGAWNPY